MPEMSGITGYRYGCGATIDESLNALQHEWKR